VGLARERPGPGHHPVVDILRRLSELHGAARRSDLVGSSAGARELARLVAEGVVVDHGGCFALPAAPEWIIRARQFRGALTCVSWAEHAGLAVLEAPGRVHLAVPANRGPKPSRVRPTHRVVLHRTVALGSGCLPDPPVMRPELALACVLTCLESVAAIVTLDSALHQKVCSADEVRAELTNRGSLLARETLDRCDPASASPLESLARLELKAGGLDVRTGVLITGVGWVDLLVEGRIVIETDGFEFHNSRAAFANDRRRDRVLAAMGFRVLRFTAEDVRTPGLVLAAVLEALGAPRFPAVVA